MDIRIVKADEIDQAIHLADQTFRGADHTSMGEAFPQVFSKNIIHSFGAFDGDTLVSFMGLVPSHIKVGGAVLNVFSIGAVCTHENYRKRGISSAILKGVYQYIDQAGASLLLISGDRGLYTRNHCYHFGRTYQYAIQQSNVHKGHYEGVIRQQQANDTFQIDEMRTKENVRFQSSLWEWSVLLESSGYTSIFNMQQACFIAEREGIIEGYVVIGLPNGKGSKQEAVVTECGGPPHIVHDILVHILVEKLAETIEIKIPWHERCHEQFSEYPSKEMNNSGTIYLVDVAKLVEQIRPYLYEKNPELAQSLEVFEINDNEFQLKGKQLHMTCTREELIGILFNVDSALRNDALQTIFPLPLPNLEGMYYV